MKFLKKLYRGIRIGTKVVNKLDAAGIIDVNEAKIVDKILDTIHEEKDDYDRRERIRDASNGVFGGRTGADSNPRK